MRPNRLARAGPSGWTVETRACPLGSYTQRQVRVHGLAKRRLCNTVEGCIGRAKACAAYRWAVTAARSRTATISNLARARRALVLRALFGGPKSCVLVNLFMICPRWLASSQPTTTKSLSDHGYLMACLSEIPPSLRLARRGVPAGAGNRPASSQGQVGRVLVGGLPFSKRCNVAILLCARERLGRVVPMHRCGGLGAISVCRASWSRLLTRWSSESDVVQSTRIHTPVLKFPRLF